MPLLTSESTALAAWRRLGYSDAVAGRRQRAPLRDDPEVHRAYLTGYKRGTERKQVIA
jgi:hypothetical protein